MANLYHPLVKRQQVDYYGVVHKQLNYKNVCVDVSLTDHTDVPLLNSDPTSVS